MIDVSAGHGAQHPFDRLYADERGSVAKVRVHEPRAHVPGHLQIAVTGVAAGADGKRAGSAEPITGTLVVLSDSGVDVAGELEAMRRSVAARVHRAADHAAQAATLIFAPSREPRS